MKREPMSPNKQTRAGIYVRVSTLNQVDRDSLRTQEERLSAYCTANGLSKIEVYKDAGYSAKNTKRPSLELLLDHIASHQIDCVLVTKLDRITRSIRDLFKLITFFEKHKVKFVSITESLDTTTAMGRFTQSLLALLAQLEREVTAERVSTDMRHRASKGKWNGGVVPFGYVTQTYLTKVFREQKGKDRNSALELAIKKCPEPKKLYVYEKEAKIVKKIFDTFLSTQSVRKTGITLNASGIRTRKGKHWPQTTIHRILRTPTYVGQIWYGKRKTNPQGKLIKQSKDSWTVVDGEHDAIISQEQFDKVQKLLSKRKGKPTKPGRTYLLSGLIRCGHCGGALSGHTYTRKATKKTYSYYKCANRLQKGTTACQGLSLPATELEEFIINEISQLSCNQEFLQDKAKMLEMVKKRLKTHDDDSQLTKIQHRIDDLNSRVNTLLEKLEQSLITDDDFKIRYDALKTEIRELEDQKETTNQMIQNHDIGIKNLEASFSEINKFTSNWEFLDELGKSLRLKSIIKEIRATKEAVDVDIFLDVANLNHMVRDSSRQ